MSEKLACNYIENNRHQCRIKHNISKVQKSMYCSIEISSWKTRIEKGEDIPDIHIFISMLSQLLKTLYK